MNQLFYVAGFIYDPILDQFLLHQTALPNNTIVPVLFGGVNKGDEKPIQAFLRHILNTTEITLAPHIVNPVYDYFDTNAQRYVFWIDFTHIKDEKYFQKPELKWLSLKELHKAKVGGRVKQDLVFFQRELNAKQVVE